MLAWPGLATLAAGWPVSLSEPLALVGSHTPGHAAPALHNLLPGTAQLGTVLLAPEPLNSFKLANPPGARETWVTTLLLYTNKVALIASSCCDLVPRYNAVCDPA